LFTWGAIHAAYRAWQLADFTNSYQVVNFAGPYYELSSSLEYLRSAGHTPREMLDKCLLEVMFTNPTPAMCSLWESDTSKKEKSDAE
jgi:hypothetical protein